MEADKEIETRVVIFKSLLMQMLLYSIGIYLVGSFFSPYQFDPLLPISSIVGIGIAMPVIYYFLNNRSFGPMHLPKASLVVILSLPFIGITATATYFSIDYVISIVI
ncbi:hypothetical protein [Amphibacillus jilinensis]|uniref:hypothetical protein n=1 Tax=Amphibacillus jilinensis TaxID=1216008 RepID=UPI000380CFEE|nr:hypothetical protein [Amphibacillus jilinensis]